jgi:hypothetical protein
MNYNVLVITDAENLVSLEVIPANSDITLKMIDNVSGSVILTHLSLTDAKILAKTLNKFIEEPF